MIETMRSQAAQLGANGACSEDFSDSDPVAVGTGVGRKPTPTMVPLILVLAASLGVVKKAAKG